MKISYYPGCTLKTKAKNLEDSALAAMAVLDVEMEEIKRWNCCGVVYSLADDDLIHYVAPVRNLIRVLEQGGDKMVTLCSMCYNTLARANLLMRNDEEKRRTINLFMDEEPDYNGEVEVLHLLTILRDHVGWDTIREKVRVPLNGMKIAPYYGCTLVRPPEVAIDEPGRPLILGELVKALGAEVVNFPNATTCCGSYQIIAHSEVGLNLAGRILQSAIDSGAEAIILSCPLCEFNLAKKQKELLAQKKLSKEIPVFYFTQLLAIALGVEEESCRFNLNDIASVHYLQSKNLLTVAT